MSEASSCPDAGSSAATPGAANLCPASQSIGSKVGLVTVKALVKGDALRRLDGRAYRYCPAPNCDVVYFDTETDSIFRKGDLTVRVGQKETEDPVPICYCFDFTLADLRSEIATEGKMGIPTVIRAEVEAGHCACEVKNPQGTCCLGHITAAVRSLSRER